MAWVNTSKPVAATTAPPRVWVVVGSTTARVGLSRLWEIPVFTCSRVRSQTAMPVVSLPVPEVVGQAICGFSGPGTGFARPIGALT